mmetsp:Transcript_14331/g.51012  ORF Transcript_14331/g.51012 Transcript_14331/m.51012 type:complete len:487 (-) Transcript_14331:519-1979(-)
MARDCASADGAVKPALRLPSFETHELTRTASSGRDASSGASALKPSRSTAPTPSPKTVPDAAASNGRTTPSMDETRPSTYLYPRLGNVIEAAPTRALRHPPARIEFAAMAVATRPLEHAELMATEGPRRPNANLSACRGKTTPCTVARDSVATAGVTARLVRRFFDAAFSRDARGRVVFFAPDFASKDRSRVAGVEERRAAEVVDQITVDAGRGEHARVVAKCSRLRPRPAARGLDAVPRHLHQLAVLRIHYTRLGSRDAPEGRVELGHGRSGDALDLWHKRRVLQQRGRHAPRPELRDARGGQRVVARGEVAPELRHVGRPRQQRRHTRHCQRQRLGRPADNWGADRRRAVPPRGPLAPLDEEGCDRVDGRPLEEIDDCELHAERRTHGADDLRRVQRVPSEVEEVRRPAHRPRRQPQRPLERRRNGARRDAHKIAMRRGAREDRGGVDGRRIGGSRRHLVRARGRVAVAHSSSGIDIYRGCGVR